MLNSKYKKAALAEADKASGEYKELYDGTIKHITQLQDKKEEAVDILASVDTYIHSISNKPPEMEKTMSEITVRRRAFENEVHELEIENKSTNKVTGGVMGGGIVAGAGVAAFAPTAAMAVAMTFGTASTGTAIATLSGAAATNAALAWLGGGALAVGGGGMAAGEALLAMAGPVGWAIGGAAILGGGLMFNSKNKKLAEKAERQTMEIKKVSNDLRCLDGKVDAEIKVVDPLNAGVENTLSLLEEKECRDYSLFTYEEKETLRQLMNSAESLSKRIGVKLS